MGRTACLGSEEIDAAQSLTVTTGVGSSGRPMARFPKRLALSNEEAMAVGRKRGGRWLAFRDQSLKCREERLEGVKSGTGSWKRGNVARALRNDRSAPYLNGRAVGGWARAQDATVHAVGSDGVLLRLRARESRPRKWWAEGKPWMPRTTMG